MTEIGADFFYLHEFIVNFVGIIEEQCAVFTTPSSWLIFTSLFSASCEIPMYL